MKPKISFTAYVATSIDGRIAKDILSKTPWTSREDWNFFQNSLLLSDVVIVGHNTFRIAKARLLKRNTIVFTSKVRDPKTVGSVTFFNPEHDDVLKFLKKNKYKKVAIIGGPKVYNFFLENKMLHELLVTIEPYVFSAGVPMFSGTKFKKHDFLLESVKKLNKRGTILLKYKYAG